MEPLEGIGSEFCATGTTESQYLCSEKQRFLNMILNRTSYTGHADIYDRKSWETFAHVWHILWTIAPVVYFFAIARIVGQAIEKRVPPHAVCRFLIEFVLIVVPTVLIVNVLNSYVGYVMIFLCVFSLAALYVVYAKKKQNRTYNLGGSRPFVLTLDRATINLLTALCILAVDFEMFPKHFRKTRRYGVGLMDVGIGLFVFAMGTVSRPPTKVAHLKQTLWTVVPLLVLGLMRTLVIMLINYEQDEHEYGVHMNAFFTLGLTKLFGCLISGLVRHRFTHLIAGSALLALHEYGLQHTVSTFVMNSDIPRDTLLRANREGICSLPGFIALYLLSIYIGQCLRLEDKVLSYRVFINKLKVLGVVNIGMWLLVAGCIFTVSIARVTCNYGYVIWILAVALTMTFLFTMVFHLILNSLCSNYDRKAVNESSEVEGLDNSTEVTTCNANTLPVLVEAVNMNGLVFFLLSNVLTGAVNIFLQPKKRSDFESLLILNSYMLITTGFVYVLHRLKIRIA
ncbi:PREDICTED: uncharacterized protein At4g17910-like [Rhagoletis zephyria]|uniref:uncharacterized protein At4g17910-like n=1 Tax=Rhagoletis zephyria TaxID=28612 RepID=UPI00081158E0|nr:PREDICTED: uncharacterized protein At4g17910-like [Rhagoletis zephyria]